MATLPQTISALEAVAGRDRATLVQYGRVIREDNLLPRGKPGGGAPQMTAENLAMLMFGIYFADAPKDAASTARRLGDYRRASADTRDDLPPVFHRIAACSTLREALTVTIAGVPDLKRAFEAYIDDAYAGTSPEAIALLKADPSSVIGFTVAVNGVQAEIECTADRKAQWSATFVMDMSKWQAGDYGFTSSDRSVRTSFSLRSLLVVGDCLAGRGPFEAPTPSYEQKEG